MQGGYNWRNNVYLILTQKEEEGKLITLKFDPIDKELFLLIVIDQFRLDKMA